MSQMTTSNEEQIESPPTVTPKEMLFCLLRIVLPLLIMLGAVCWLVFYVPRIKALCADFGIEVSPLALLMFDLSDWLIGYWWLAIGGLLLPLIVSVAIEIPTLQRRRKAVAWLWFAVAAGIPLLLWGSACWALTSVVRRLVEGLS